MNSPYYLLYCFSAIKGANAAVALRASAIRKPNPEVIPLNTKYESYRARSANANLFYAECLLFPKAAVWTIIWEKEAWPVFALLSPEVGTSRLLNLQLFPTELR